jgi:hypothetical protein
MRRQPVPVSEWTLANVPNAATRCKAQTFSPAAPRHGPSAQYCHDLRGLDLSSCGRGEARGMSREGPMRAAKDACQSEPRSIAAAWLKSIHSAYLAFTKKLAITDNSTKDVRS